MTRDEAIALGVIGGIAGIGLIYLGFSARNDGPLQPMPDGIVLQEPDVPGLHPPITVHVKGSLTLVRPTILFYSYPPKAGIPWGTFAYASIKQDGVTVMGSGVAQVNVGPASSLKSFQLVSDQQLQPDLSHRPDLDLYPWPGPPGCGNIPGAPACINGRSPVPGEADLFLEVYGNALETGDKRDGDGLASPTENRRVPIVRRVWHGGILFVQG